MGMAVKNRADGVTIQRIFKPARSSKGKNFWRFSHHGFNNRGIVEQRNSMGCSEPGRRGFELYSFCKRCMHKSFDSGLPPVLQCSFIKSAGETFDPGEADSVDFA